MKAKNLQGIALISLIFSFCLFILFLCLFFTNVWNRSLLIIGVAVNFVYFIFSLLAYFNSRMFPVLPFVLNILIITLLVAGIGHLRVYCVLLIPIIFAMYYGSSLLTKIIIIFNLLTFAIYPYMYCKNQLQLTGNSLIVFSIMGFLGYAVELAGVTLLSKRFIVDANMIRKENELYSSLKKDSVNNTIEVYMALVKNRNLKLSVHIDTVVSFANLILDELELNENYKKTITPEYKSAVIKGAYLHELGRLNLDKALIGKFYDFTPEEEVVINKTYYEAINVFNSFSPDAFTEQEKVIISHILQQQKEFLNGTGEPNHLIGLQISLESQIISIADLMASLLINQKGSDDNDFNTVYIELITKGFDKYNQDVVNCVYEKRQNIIKYADSVNFHLKKQIKSH